MTKIAIVPNAAGTGTFTIEAPNSNSNRTLTLPDLAGTVLTDASNIEAQVKTATNATGSAPVYACRAWVNFDGATGSGNTIRASGNVSSITRNSTGVYTVNLTTALTDANYVVVVTARGLGGASFGAHNKQFTAPTTSAVPIVCVDPAGGGVNSDHIDVAIFR
jgi:hypothetical protein